MEIIQDVAPESKGRLNIFIILDILTTFAALFDRATTKKDNLEWLRIGKRW